MATKKAGGSSKNGRDSVGKRLGVKIYGGSIAKKGSIILRQKGLKWKPGNFVKKGVDFTLYALVDGTVQFVYNQKTKKCKINIIPLVVNELLC